ncbi:MAG TPA: helix-turn-helix domain-containing protein, partial [Nannocystis exedens]|nr:helix-turn-helix domain-containing protein [Nannocystis exedens]
GREACAIDGRTHHLQAGDLLLLNPEQVHTGHADADETIDYISLYGDPQWVGDLARDLGARTTPTFTRAQVEQERGLGVDLERLWHSYTTVADPDAALAREEAALTLFGRALGTYADLNETRRRVRRRPPRRLRRVVEYFHDRRGPTDLESLAAIAGISKYHFIRSFTAELGMTPAAYLRNLRISEAAGQIRRGRTIEAAASHAGFGNLRSFRRAFSGLLGTTPHSYARMCAPRRSC